MIPLEIIKKAHVVQGYLGLCDGDKNYLKRVLAEVKELTELILIKYCFEEGIKQESLIIN